MGRVLIIAYHFPPCLGSSGLLRTEKFARYLPEFGWEPIVLTVHPRAYEATDLGSQQRVNAVVLRAFALDTKKHLSVKNRYFEWMALPDRWVTWLFAALPAALRTVRKHHIQVIFSTFPISTAVLIALLLHYLTGLPWILDLRDSMTEDDYPKDPRTRKLRRWIESRAVSRASCIAFTAESTRQMYLARYPKISADKCVLIPNGYDEEDFSSLRVRQPADHTSATPLRLLHTGVIYPDERDPLPFFRALSRLKREGKIDARNLRIVLRAAGSEDFFHQAIKQLDIADIVELAPHIPYKMALQECADSGGLLLFQAKNCDHQIPAKAYEYLRLGKAIFALTTQTGDTAALLNEVGGATIADLSDEQDIYQRFPSYLAALSSDTHPLPQQAIVQSYARRMQAAQLAKCLSKVSEQNFAAEKPQSTNVAGPNTVKLKVR